MSRSYTATQDITISGSETDDEIELKMIVDFIVHPGCKQTLVDPGEEPTAEIRKIRCFHADDAVQLPNRVEDFLTPASWLLREAGEQEEAARDEAADHKREMMREDI